VRKASKRGGVWTWAILDAGGLVVADVTVLCHLSRIEWQRADEGEVIAVEITAKEEEKEGEEEEEERARFWSEGGGCGGGGLHADGSGCSTLKA
jgi:hypothetical protein